MPVALQRCFVARSRLCACSPRSLPSQADNDPLCADAPALPPVAVQGQVWPLICQQVFNAESPNHRVTANIIIECDPFPLVLHCTHIRFEAHHYPGPIQRRWVASYISPVFKPLFCLPVFYSAPGKQDGNIAVPLRWSLAYPKGWPISGNQGDLHRIDWRQVLNQQLPTFAAIPAVKNLSIGGTNVNTGRVQGVGRHTFP